MLTLTVLHPIAVWTLIAIALTAPLQLAAFVEHIAGINRRPAPRRNAASPARTRHTP